MLSATKVGNQYSGPRLEADWSAGDRPSLPAHASLDELGVDLDSYSHERIVVQFDTGSKRGFAAQNNLPLRGLALGDSLGSDGLYEVNLSSNITPEQAVAALEASPGVSFAHPDFWVSITATPDDPSFSDLWGFNNTGQTGGNHDADIDAVEAWDVRTDASSVVVAVIDSGIDYTHPDLVDNMWVNSEEIAGDGIDNDGNGYVDDIHGWDFANGDADPMDDDGHGTHVAGTIGAQGNNAVGVAGVAWDVQLMALKFLGADGRGSTADALKAVNYARENGANIANNSYGGGPSSTSFQNAINRFVDSGGIFVAAAGNHGRNNDINPYYPANYDNVISVAASTDRDTRASFSGYGVNTVDIAAPGESILSTIPGGRYARFNGTSMATPVVSGALALVAADYPLYTNEELINRLMWSADPVLTGSTKYGRLNLYTALGGLDPDDQISEAKDLGVVTTSKIERSGIISPGREVDMYKATVGAAQAVRFELSVESSLDGYMILFDADGHELAASSGSTLDYRFFGSGDYYIGVSSSNNRGYDPVTGRGDVDSHTTGRYTISVEEIWLDPSDEISEALSLGSVTTNATEYDGEIRHINDVDMYHVVASSGQRVGFRVDTPVGGLDPVLRLFDSSGRELAVNDNSNGNDSELEYRFADGGDYYFGVSASGNANYDAVTGENDLDAATMGDYTVSFIELPGPPPVGNSNDQISEAIDLGSVTRVGVEYIGSIDFPTDVDMYRIVGQRRQSVAIDIDTYGSVDSYLRLFNKFGREVASNDKGVAPGEACTPDSYLTYEFDYDGEYYIGVSGAGNNSYDPETGGGDEAASTTGIYALSIVEIDDANDQISEAISFGQVTRKTKTEYDQINHSTDVDMYSIQVRANQRIDVRVNKWSSHKLRSTIRIFDKNGNELASNQSRSKVNSRVKYRFATAGTYYVAVSARPNSSFDPLSGEGDLTNNQAGWYRLRIKELR